MGVGGHFPEPGEFAVTLVKAALGVQIAVAARVQLDHLGADPVRGVDLARVGGNEDRDPAAHVAQGRDEMGQPVFVLGHFEPALGRPFLALFGHDADGVGFVAERDLLHLVGRCHLEVEGQFQRLHQPVDVVVRDVAAVFAEMGGDAVRARLFGELRGPDRVGVGAAAGIPHGGHVVDIHAEAEGLFSHGAFRPSGAAVPGLPLTATLRASGGAPRIVPSVF